MPERIQRKRKKGWRMPVNTVYVGRPTIFGNPFDLRYEQGGRTEAVKKYELWLSSEGDKLFPRLAQRRVKLLEQLSILKGKNLACWCSSDQPCHADVLLKLANTKKYNESD